MTEQEFVEGITLLGTCFGKDYSQVEVKIYYDMIKEYSNEVWTAAVTRIIKTQTFAPKIADLIKELEDSKKVTQFSIIDVMAEDGYFKRPDFNYKRIEKEYEELKQQEDVSDIQLELKEEELTTERDRMTRDEIRSIDKAKMWIQQDCIPDWLLNDMRKYYLAFKNKQISNTTTKLKLDYKG